MSPVAAHRRRRSRSGKTSSLTSYPAARSTSRSRSAVRVARPLPDPGVATISISRDRLIRVGRGPPPRRVPGLRPFAEGRRARRDSAHRRQPLRATVWTSCCEVRTPRASPDGEPAPETLRTPQSDRPDLAVVDGARDAVPNQRARSVCPSTRSGPRSPSRPPHPPLRPTPPWTPTGHPPQEPGAGAATLPAGRRPALRRRPGRVTADAALPRKSVMTISTVASTTRRGLAVRIVTPDGFGSVRQRGARGYRGDPPWNRTLRPAATRPARSRQQLRLPHASLPQVPTRMRTSAPPLGSGQGRPPWAESLPFRKKPADRLELHSNRHDAPPCRSPARVSGPWFLSWFNTAPGPRFEKAAMYAKMDMALYPRQAAAEGPQVA